MQKNTFQFFCEFLENVRILFSIYNKYFFKLIKLIQSIQIKGIFEPEEIEIFRFSSCIDCPTFFYFRFELTLKNVQQEV